jgi:ribosomal protein S18 acetylase RimI-like enzyme
MSGLVVRAAEAEDAGLAAAMQSALVETYGPLMDSDPAAALIADGGAQRYFEEHWSMTTVAVLVGEIVGVAVLLGDVLDLIWVAPGRRSRGVGAAMLCEVERQAAAVHDRLRLEVWRLNERAVTFYVRHGFVVEGVMPDEPGFEKLTLSKTITRR